MRTIASWTFVAAMLLAGCRSGGNRELLERELRMQEDRIYQLEAMLHECSAVNDSARRENEALKSGIEGADADASPTPGGSSSSSPGSSTRRPSGTNQVEPEGPIIEPGVPAPTPGASDAQGTGGTPAQDAGFNHDEQVVDETVTRLVLNKQLTGGRSYHGDKADEGLMVVFEPRNAANQLVHPLGDVSIVVLDPDKRGAEARVARWDFTADEASARFKKTALGRGFHFDLPWPDTPPTSKTLRLFVRLTVPGGAKFVTDAMIPVDPPDRQVKRWSPVPRSVLNMPPQRLQSGPVARDDEHGAPSVDDAATSERPTGRDLRGARRPRRPVWAPYR